MVHLVPDYERDVHKERPQRVHGANVIEHPRVVEHDAAHDGQKVEAPEHLEKAAQRKVLADVVVGKVSKPSHPDIAGDVQPNAVVLLAGLKIVVHHEQDLHPTLPLLGHVAVEVGRVVGGVFLAGRPQAHLRETTWREQGCQSKPDQANKHSSSSVTMDRRCSIYVYYQDEYAVDERKQVTRVALDSRWEDRCAVADEVPDHDDAKLHPASVS